MKSSVRGDYGLRDAVRCFCEMNFHVCHGPTFHAFISLVEASCTNRESFLSAFLFNLKLPDLRAFLPTEFPRLDMSGLHRRETRPESPSSDTN